MKKENNNSNDIMTAKKASNKLMNNINLLLRRDNSFDDCSMIEIEVYGIKQKHCLFTMQQTINEINKYLIEFIKIYGSSKEGREQFCRIINYILNVISEKEQQVRCNGEQIHGDYYNAYFFNINGGDNLRTIMSFNNVQMRNIIFNDYNGNINFNFANQIIDNVKNNDEEKELLKNNLYSAYTDYLISNNKLDIEDFLDEFITIGEKLSIVFQFAKTFYTGKLNEKYINKKYEEIFLTNFLNIARSNDLNFKECFKEMLKNVIVSSLNIPRLSVPLVHITTYLIENGEKEIIKDMFDSIKELANDEQICAKYPFVEDGLKKLHKEVSIQVLNRLDEERELEEIEDLTNQIDSELMKCITVENSNTVKYSEYKETLINECGLYNERCGVIDNMIYNVSNGIKYLTEAKDKTINFGKKIVGTVFSGINYLFGSLSKQTDDIKKSELLKKETNSLSECFSELNSSLNSSIEQKIEKFD